MSNFSKVPFGNILLESRDGEWGSGEHKVGYHQCNIIRGTDFSSIYSPTTELPQRWVSGHLVERKKLLPLDILFEMAGGTATQSTGRSALIKRSIFKRFSDKPLLCASFCRHLRIDQQQYSPPFIYYLLQALYNAGYMAVFNTQHTGVSRFQYTSFKKITNLDVPLLPIQRKIAAVLSAYDDLIENNNRRIALLEKIAEELYREWFVRLRFPGHEKVKIVKSVPEGWEVVELSKIAEEASKSTKPGSHLENRFYLPIDSLQQRHFNPESHLGYEEALSSLVTFQKGDILFGAMRPYLHKVCIAPFDGITRTTCFVIRPRDKVFYSYLYLSLFQNSTIEYATLICNGADRPYVVWNKAFERMPIFKPSEVIVQKFENLVRSIILKISRSYFSLQTLRTFRDRLLSRLMSGKIDVEDLDIRFPASMGTPDEDEIETPKNS